MSIAGRNHIGPYRLLRLVRAGSTCQIWEVISEADNRRCALKALQPEMRASKEQIAFLRHEYDVARTLDHPSVIKVFDYNVARGVPYLALEYFESMNLKQWMRQDPERLQQILPTVIQRCAEGLAHVHEQGWVHRDVKPDNFLVNDRAEVRLIDFAIAQRIRRGWGRLLAGRAKVQGTRSYMSPEQIRGESIDPRSDLYSLGCLLFELHAGRPPYTAGNADEVLQKHLKAPVPLLSSLCDTVTPEHTALITRMMAKDRDERPGSVRDFLSEFRQTRMFRGPGRSNSTS